MKKNLKFRTLLRSSATKNIREIEAEMETESPSRETIGIKYEVLETIENQLRDANVQVMNLLLEDEAISSPDLEKEQDMVVQYEESFVRTKRRVAKYLQVRETGQQGRDTLDPARSAQEGMSSCKLPKMALPVFDGTCLEWMGWWSRFEMIHESAVLSEVEKFQYLVQSMKVGTRADRLVKSYPLTTENYPKTLTLEGLYDQVESHLRALESLGVTTQQNASFLYPLVESSLPEDLLRIWQRSALAGYGGDELELPITIDQRLERLLEFLRREVKGDQRLEYMKEGFGESSQRRNYGQHIARMHAAQITEAKGRVTPLCLRCKGNHWIQDCAGWRSMTVTKRRDEIRKFNACFRCLRVGHVIATCRTQFRCSHCKGFHHTVLHLPRRVSMEDQDQRERQNTEEPRISPGEQEIALSGMHVRTAIPTALLATARVRLVGPRGVGVTVRALLDQGSQSSFVHRDLLHHLTIPVHKVNAQIYGINDTKGEHVKQMVSCSVASLTESGWTMPIRALVVGRMTGILPGRDLRIPVPSSWKTLPLADPQFETSGRVDVILGADVYGSLLLPEVKYDEKTQLCAQKTRLGWIVSGKLPGEGEVGPHRVYNIRVNYEENLDNVLRQLGEVEEVPLRHAKLDTDEFCEELYKTRSMAKMERHEKRSRTPASRTGEKISEYFMSKEEYTTGRVKLTKSKDGCGSERVNGKADKLCPASAMVKVTERKPCPDSSVLKRPEESTCPDCSKVKGSMCPHCAKMKEIGMLTCQDSAKVKAELCPDSSRVEVDREEPSPELWPKMPKDRKGWKRFPDVKPKDYDRLEEKESDRRILSIDELAEELMESYKEFPPVHVKVDKCGNLDEHWLRRKIREDLCQVPPKIPPYIRMSDSTKLKVEKLREMACFLKSTNVLGDLQTGVVNLDMVEELLKSRPKCENRESVLDIYENLDLEQRTLDIVQESNFENPNCEEKMADSKLVQSHVEICRGDEEPDDRSMSISRYVAQHVPTASCCGYLQNGREREMQDIYDDAKISKEAAKKEKVEQPHEISLSCQLLQMNGNLNGNPTVGCSESLLDSRTSGVRYTESVCCNDLDTEICPLFEDSIGEELHNLLQPKVKPPHQESLIENLTENDDIPGAIDENHEEDSSILETTFVIEDEEPNEAIGTPRIEISEVSVIAKSEGKDSKEPMVRAEALDKKLCHDDPAHLNMVETDLNRPKEATSGIINVSTESKDKAAPVETVDPSTKDYLQSGEKAKLSRWKLIDSRCLEDFKESENDDEKYSSSAYMEWPEILKKEVLKHEALEKAVKQLRIGFYIARDQMSEIAETLANDGTEWKFNPPGAPHFGGLWEAGIKCFKYHFRRIIGETLLTYEEFLTLIVQIEACLNSRPLGPISGDPNDLAVLTPAHFLLTSPSCCVPEEDLLSAQLLPRWKMVQKMVQHLWRQWSADYIHNLQQRHKWRTPRPNVATGSLVLVREEHVPPAKWIMGRVVEIHPGKDGLVRVVSIRTKAGLLKRPLVKLALLPVPHSFAMTSGVPLSGIVLKRYADLVIQEIEDMFLANEIQMNYPPEDAAFPTDTVYMVEGPFLVKPLLLLLSCPKKSLRCLHASPSQQQQYPLSWVCKAAALGLCQISARLRPLLAMRISFWLPLPIHLPFHNPRSQHGQESIVECSSSPMFPVGDLEISEFGSPYSHYHSPCLVFLKIIYLDESIPENVKARWNSFQDEIGELKKLKILRCIMTDQTGPTFSFTVLVMPQDWHIQRSAIRDQKPATKGWRCKKTTTYVSPRDAAERDLGCTGDCEFEGLHEQLIRDRIVVGVRDKALSERMQLDSELTLEKAVKMVRQQEAVRQQQVDLQRPSTSQKVNQVKFNSKKQSPKQQQQPSRKKEKSAKTRSRCPKCGGFTHREGQACRAEGQKCNLCSKTGHFANCCPDKQAKTAEVKAVSELDEEIGFLLEVSAVEDSSNLDDDEGECRRRWTAEIQVNGEKVKFKLDSQADVTCVPLCLFKKIMGQQRLVKSDINLRAAEFSELQTVGMFISTLRNGNYEIKEKIYVIRRLSEPLLSRRACELMNLARRIEVVATRINPIKEFPEVFEGLGQIGNPYEIKLKPGAKTYALHTHRRVTIPLMEELKTRLDIPGKELLDADALSRQPLLTTEGGEDERPTSAHINAVLSSITDKDEMLTKIFEAQQEDTTLKAVVNYLEQGWPDNNKMSQALLSYWHVKDELGVQNGLLIRSCRLVIPASMKLEILNKLHAGHFGITKTRLRARETVWWPGISEEIAETVRKCSVCIQEAVSKHEPLIPTNFPTRPWQKIGMDLFKFENKWYLVVIDYYSRFPEVVQLDRLTANVVVRGCKSIFARHGIPETVVSDNGTQFGAAREFANFARQYGFTHVTSSPRFPQSNGMAEAGVKIAKMILKKNLDPSLGLLEYRSTPLENGYSPAELLMGRKLRTTLPIAPENLNPKLVDSQTLKRKEGRRRKDMKSRYDRRYGATDMEELSEGDTVWITDMRTWGIVKQKASTPSLKKGDVLRSCKKTSTYVSPRDAAERDLGCTVYFSRIITILRSEEIAETVRKCSVCIQEAVSKHEPLIPTNFPTRPWQKIGMDLFKFENKWYLVVIDYYSRFPEVVQLDRLTANVVVRGCKSIFARHGIPETVVSDNGTQFGAAREFANFARQYGFTHVTSSPRFPQSNGMAEAGVKIAKMILKKNLDPSLGLLEYRSTPLENGYSPAELLMGRKLRTTLPIAPENLNPKLVDSQTLKRKEGRRRKDMKSRYDRRYGATDMEELSEGDTVWITDMRTWGIVKQKASTPRSYLVDTPVGTLRRNRFHLRKGVTVQYPADPSTPTFSGEELVENEKTPVVDYPSNDSEDGQIRTR
ncbi:K02A2.6-like, partial [Cordylochernes scorpioides]